MGTKWSSTSISGYNAGPPSDDGAQTEANKVKYSTITTNLTDPLNSALTTTLSRLNELLDEAPKAKTGNYTTVASDNARTIECDGTFTVTLLAAASGGTGYKVRVKNIGTGLVTVAGTIDGGTNLLMRPKTSAILEVNAAADGYLIVGASRGGVVQRVEATPYTTPSSDSSTFPLDGTIPQLSEGGGPYLTATITPTKSTNRLVIECTMVLGSDTSNTVTVALFQDSTANALTASCHGWPGASYMATVPLRHEMAAGTTSATSFTIRLGVNNGSVYINRLSNVATLFGGVIACRLSVTEIEA